MANVSDMHVRFAQMLYSCSALGTTRKEKCPFIMYEAHLVGEQAANGGSIISSTIISSYRCCRFHKTP
ncbi:hypothetical protein BofuT4_uP037620.1 [Botrytis cinerea T4]|uniref:Uncharacterized protein n=1 Tax=Botryotinia fuckeliana (strain T4) TaxID=999810 RepID=G2Y542_BOTF4|nr:hypothetical protein BofuT4_uP037620.1 [Botrytis cinerea T4]